MVGARVAARICVAALAVRIAWAAWAGVTPRVDFYDDSYWHHAAATRLAGGEGYVNPFTGLPTAQWPPGYAVVLGGVYALLGPNPFWGLVLNAVAGAATCLLVWRLAALATPPRAALIAAALCAAFPAQIAFASLIMSETIFAMLVCLLALAIALLLSRERDRARDWLLCGVAVGLAALVRAEAIGLAVVPAAALATRREWRRALRVITLAVAGVVVALAPWTYRNALVFGSFVPLSTSAGRTFFVGHNPIAGHGMSRELLETMNTTVESRYAYPPSPRDEIAKDREYRRRARDFAVANPGAELRLIPSRIYYLFRGDHMWLEWYASGSTRLDVTSPTARLLGKLSNAYYAAVLLLAAAGFVLWCRSRSLVHRFLQFVVVYWVAFFGLIYGEARYHLALMPILCVMAADALDRMLPAAERSVQAQRSDARSTTART